MACLYADEDVDDRLVERLRLQGHDVVTVTEAGKSGSSDVQVLADATADQRAVLTFNRWDFEKLHRKNSGHSGIISCSRDSDLDALAARINRTITSAGALTGIHLRVNKVP